jgi:hypothetical protein
MSIFASLPLEVASHVLAYLSFTDLLQLRRVCRRLYDTAVSADPPRLREYHTLDSFVEDIDWLASKFTDTFPAIIPKSQYNVLRMTPYSFPRDGLLIVLRVLTCDHLVKTMVANTDGTKSYISGEDSRNSIRNCSNGDRSIYNSETETCMVRVLCSVDDCYGGFRITAKSKFSKMFTRVEDGVSRFIKLEPGSGNTHFIYDTSAQLKSSMIRYSRVDDHDDDEKQDMTKVNHGMIKLNCGEPGLSNTSCKSSSTVILVDDDDAACEITSTNISTVTNTSTKNSLYYEPSHKSLISCLESGHTVSAMIEGIIGMPIDMSEKPEQQFPAQGNNNLSLLLHDPFAVSEPPHDAVLRPVCLQRSCGGNSASAAHTITTGAMLEGVERGEVYVNVVENLLDLPITQLRVASYLRMLSKRWKTLYVT